MSEVVAGIDFGTTNSSIAVADRDRIEVLDLIPGHPVPGALPSVGYLHRIGNRLAGEEAIRTFLVTGGDSTACSRCSLVERDHDGAYSKCAQFRVGGACQDSRLIAGLKSELSNSEFARTHSWAVDFELEDLASIVISDLRRRAEQATGARVVRLVLGHPVAFVGTEGPHFESLQQLAEGRLVEAAHRAGFREVELFPEPAAAVLDEILEDGVTVSVDFGGGTFDVAVIEVSGGEGEVIALRGAPIGGSLFDELIFDKKVAPLLALEREVGASGRLMPRWFASDLRSLGGVKRLLSNPLVPLLITEIAETDARAGALLDSILFGGMAHEFYGSIEQAKIALSTRESTSIEFRSSGPSLSIPLSRVEFERMIAEHLDVVEFQIKEALRAGGADISEVRAVVRTGGSSQLGAFVERLERMFGPERVRARDAFTSVAYGLGMVAKEMWT